MVLDEGSKKLVDGVVREDDILEANVTSAPDMIGPFLCVEAEKALDVEQIEDKRPMNTSVDAIYLLSPLPHILDCLMADLERRRYRRSYLIWTSG